MSIQEGQVRVLEAGASLVCQQQWEMRPIDLLPLTRHSRRSPFQKPPCGCSRHQHEAKLEFIKKRAAHTQGVGVGFSGGRITLNYLSPCCTHGFVASEVTLFKCCNLQPGSKIKQSLKIQFTVILLTQFSHCRELPLSL